jgi:hypothetical protein
MFFNLGAPITLHSDVPWATNQWLSVRDVGMKGQKITSLNSNFSWSMLTMAAGIGTNLHTIPQLLLLQRYLATPEGLTIHRGRHVERNMPLLELTPDKALQTAELSVPRPAPALNPAAEGLMLPLRVGPFNPRWTVGLFQLEGFVIGYYGVGSQRYTSLGLDGQGFAYAPLYAARAPLTHVLVGCPVVATGLGAENLFIQVTHVDEKPQVWHVEIQNPMMDAVTVTVNRTMALPGLSNLLKGERRVTIDAGGFVVL